MINYKIYLQASSNGESINKMVFKDKIFKAKNSWVGRLLDKPQNYSDVILQLFDELFKLTYKFVIQELNPKMEVGAGEGVIYTNFQNYFVTQPIITIIILIE